jgi:hypothetical protein
MDKLERMFGHLSNMTPDELRAHVRQVRADRRQTKIRPGVVRKAKRETLNDNEKAKKLIAKVSDLELLARMVEKALKG